MVFVMGGIYLGSQVVFNAIVGSSLVLMNVSIALPLFFLMLSGRDKRFLPKKGHWNLGVWGCGTHGVATVWAVVVVVFYCLPTTRPVTGVSSMKYASVVLVVFGLVAAVDWCLFARRRYRGLTIDVKKLERLLRELTESVDVRGDITYDGAYLYMCYAR